MTGAKPFTTSSGGSGDNYHEMLPKSAFPEKGKFKNKHTITSNWNKTAVENRVFRQEIKDEDWKWLKSNNIWWISEHFKSCSAPMLYDAVEFSIELGAGPSWTDGVKK